jgi:hypothetical protein
VRERARVRACRCTTSLTAPASASSASGRSRSSWAAICRMRPGPIESSTAGCSDSTAACRSIRWAARRAGDWRRARLRAGALVCRAQGQRAQRADRGAAARAASARGRRGGRPAPQLAVRRAGRQLRCRGQAALSPARAAGERVGAARGQRPDRIRRRRSAPRRPASSRCSTSRDDAWAVACRAGVASKQSIRSQPRRMTKRGHNSSYRPPQAPDIIRPS